MLPAMAGTMQTYSTRRVEDAVRSRRLQQARVDTEEQFKQPMFDRVAQEMFMTEIFRTMWVVLEQMFKPPYTLQYPFEKGPLSPRFRGEHALRRYPTGKTLFLDLI